MVEVGGVVTHRQQPETANGIVFLNLEDETGLVDMGGRFYDPWLGRFVSADPIGLEGGHASYGYGQNPLRWLDPLGLAASDPKNLNFSQRTVGGQVGQYESDMKAGKWDWGKSGPLRVMDVNGQLVSYDNRRLLAAQNANLASVPVEVVDPNAIMPGSKKTWAQAFARRRCHDRNREAGGDVPEQGLKSKPKIMERK